MQRISATMTTAALTATALLFGAAPADAFDGRRQGFVLGVGAGAHFSSYDVDGNDPRFRRDRDDGGLALEVQVGYGVSDRLAIYFEHVLTLGDDHTTGLFGAGATLWVNRGAPSLYFEGAIGVGVVVSGRDGYSYDYDDDDDGRYYYRDDPEGFAGRVAVGFEFANRFQVEAGLLGIAADVDDRNERNERADVDVVSGQVLASYIWY